MEKISKGKKITFSFLLLSTVFFIVLYNYKNLKDISTKGVLPVIIILISMIFIQIFLFFKPQKIENTFILIAGILGIIFMFMLPPLQGPDERVHMVRSYDLAKGRVFFMRHDNSLLLPESMNEYTEKIKYADMALNKEAKITKEEYEEAKNIPLNKKNKILNSAPKTESYSSIAYMPQSIGMFIGDLFNWNFHYVFMMGRLTNFIFWLTLCYIALKIMPTKKELMMFLMLLPISIQQAATISPDSMLNSCSFLLIAYIMNIKYKEKKVTIKNCFIILLLCIGIVSVKLPYIIISAMLLTIPKEKFQSKMQMKKILIFFGIMILTLGAFVTWSKVSMPKQENNIEISNSDEGEEGYVYTIKQVLRHPVKFASVLGRTIKEDGRAMLDSFVARLGCLNVFPPKFLPWMALTIIIFLTFNSDKDCKINLWDRVVYFSVGFGLLLLLFIIVFKWWGADFDVPVLYGFQGRYIYPLCIPLLMSISKYKKGIDKYYWMVPQSSIFILTFSISTLLTRFWI